MFNVSSHTHTYMCVHTHPVHAVVVKYGNISLFFAFEPKMDILSNCQHNLNMFA